MADENTPKETVLYVEIKDIILGIGIHVNIDNWALVPKGRLHLARFENSFYPMGGQGYLGDRYWNQFKQNWKARVKSKKERFSTIYCLLKKNILNEDVIKKIAEYIYCVKKY